MNRALKWIAPAMVLALVGTGCATGKQQDRILSLESANKDMANRLNQQQQTIQQQDADIEELLRQRDEMGRRLVQSTSEIDNLRAELSAKPLYQEPQVPAGWTAVPGGGMIAIPGSVLFPPGKKELRNEAKRTLDGIVSTLNNEYSGKDIVIVGHTDDQPIKKSGWDDNWQLSTERSLSVSRYLLERGVTPGRLVAAGCGEHRPASAGDRATNRRVEIFAIEKWGG